VTARCQGTLHVHRKVMFIFILCMYQVQALHII
jgi:hypothetical protein